ncbi:MAG: penicillin-binding protein 2 [Patescibacteria group bacterium]|nr:penicillin-binding protein 2 [Patescibacteria group bacterium]
MKKRKNYFKPLTGVKAKNTHIGGTKHSANERWIFGVLPADKDAPGIEDEKSEKRFHSFFVAIAILFVVLFGRSFYLQVVRGQESLTLAQENRFRIQTIRAPRGLFYDRNKTALVKNIPNYEVTVIPNDLPKDEAEREVIYHRLAETIEVKVEDIKKKAEEKGLQYTQPLLVDKSVSRDVSLVFESRQTELKGFYVGTNPIREYLDNGLLSHVFGYVGRISEDELAGNEDYILTDYIGKSGLERTYEDILKGVNGKERIEVDSAGEIIRRYGQEEPILGDNMVLSIDFNLQKKLTEELTRQMKKAKVEKASAVAVNPQNGEVLAFVSLPTYDNNLFAKGISEKDYEKLLNDENSPLLNRVITGEYPSGSIIKPYIAAAALDEGTITENTTVHSTGGIKIGEWEFPDWKKGGHGVTNVFKAIAESVNTFFYAISGGYKDVKGLGPDKIKEYLTKFGFGKYVGLDIEGESLGHIPTPEWKEEVKNEPWYLGDTYHMGIGQGDVLVTPLQMVNALSTVANGGTMYKLHFLKSIVDSDGNVKSEKSKEVVATDIFSKETIAAVRKGMRQTVTSGSGRALNSLPVTAAGKTGTAQYGPNNEKKHAWFTAFAPYEKPTIAMVVLLEGAGEGSDYAVPVANETLRWYFK